MKHQLIADAIDSYHRFRPTRIATPQSDRAFLCRIVVNHLKHQEPRYNVRKSEAEHAAMKQQVLESIARQHPFLVAECYRQLEQAA